MSRREPASTGFLFPPQRLTAQDRLLPGPRESTLATKWSATTATLGFAATRLIISLELTKTIKRIRCKGRGTLGTGTDRRLAQSLFEEKSTG